MRNARSRCSLGGGALRRYSRGSKTLETQQFLRRNDGVAQAFDAANCMISGGGNGKPGTPRHHRPPPKPPFGGGYGYVHRPRPYPTGSALLPMSPGPLRNGGHPKARAPRSPVKYLEIHPHLPPGHRTHGSVGPHSIGSCLTWQTPQARLVGGARRKFSSKSVT